MAARGQVPPGHAGLSVNLMLAWEQGQAKMNVTHCPGCSPLGMRMGVARKGV